MGEMESDVDEAFIGHPVGWFGSTWKRLTHVSLLNRWSHTTEYPEGLTKGHGRGPRFTNYLGVF